MKFLLDQGLPRSACDVLKTLGVEAEHVGELGLEPAEDVDILKQGLQRNAVIVTLDGDFHRLLALSHQTSPSVIRIRIEGLKGPQMAALLIDIINKCGEELTKGAVVSVETQRIRIHQLPLP